MDRANTVGFMVELLDIKVSGRPSRKEVFCRCQCVATQLIHPMHKEVTRDAFEQSRTQGRE